MTVYQTQRHKVIRMMVIQQYEKNPYDIMLQVKYEIICPLVLQLCKYLHV